MKKYIAKKPDKMGKVHFTSEENKTWQILMERQLKVIQNRACDEFMQGIKTLNLPLDVIPQCGDITEILKATTGWSVKPVDAIIPLTDFFTLLANRQFPAATFIRVREELDFLKEPDIFHEYFGHCPMLTHQAYADFVQYYGELALGHGKEIQSLLGRLFWFTIEFGLVNTADGLRIYGGGILSSYQETQYALEDPMPKRINFDLQTVLNTSYHYDAIQQVYYILNDLSDLFHLKNADIINMIKKSVNGPQDNNFVIC